ncbi:MAG TPA: YtxH domain-containing protein [Acidobacteriota bacterium]|jgi:gas vesicle protein
MANKSGENFLYFLIGSFVGASVALLMAPKSGKETRDVIAGKAKEGADFLSTRSREVAERVGAGTRGLQSQASGLKDRSVEVLGRQKEQLSAAIEAGKQAYRDEKSKLQEE